MTLGTLHPLAHPSCHLTTPIPGRTPLHLLMRAGSPCSACCAGGRSEDGDVNTIEAAVEKMSRLVAHFTSGGGQGTQALKSVAQVRAQLGTAQHTVHSMAQRTLILGSPCLPGLP